MPCIQHWKLTIISVLDHFGQMKKNFEYSLYYGRGKPHTKPASLTKPQRRRTTKKSKLINVDVDESLILTGKRKRKQTIFDWKEFKEYADVPALKAKIFNNKTKQGKFFTKLVDHLENKATKELKGYRKKHKRRRRQKK